MTIDLTDVPTTRLGMTLLGVHRKTVMVTRNGKRQASTCAMAKIRCSCKREFSTTLSKWRCCKIDSCKACAIRKNKNSGVGVHSVRVKGGPAWKSVG